MSCQITVSFEQAAFGCEEEIDIVRAEKCTLCHGLGTTARNQTIRCPNCGGAGEVRRIQQTFFGRFVNRVVCERCYGEGTIFDQPCRQCRGTGKESKQRRLAVKIPAGVEDGFQLRFSGEGNVGIWGGRAGDLYVYISVEHHKFFERQGNNILYELPINFAQAALGDKIEVSTLDGTVTLNIKAGTQAGEIFRLKGKGIPYVNRQGRGDQLVRIRLVTPEKLNREQRRIFLELAKSLDKAKALGQREKVV